MEPLGLYVHIPFCRRKCFYCDFVSYPGKEALADGYIEAVIKEAVLYKEYLEKRSVDTLFIGGGTPSLLSPKQFLRLVSGLGAVCRFDLNEATAEANPETLDEEKIDAYARAGISRLSVGLQSHDDGILRRIGRAHAFRDFAKAYETAAKRFSNINVDVIFGLPGQSSESFVSTLEAVLNFSPQHISAYSLKLEPGTALAEGYEGASEETDRRMYHAAARILSERGYRHYETSNFARPGFECAHNLKYWTGAEYVGLGAAAHSYITDGVHKRRANTRSLEGYIAAVNRGEKPVAEETVLSETDILTEYIMLRLRLKSGIDFAGFEKRFGFSFADRFAEQIETAKKAGLIERDEHGIYPTLSGFDLQNALICEFVNAI